MLIPIGHENSEVRRLPIVTITIMVLCVLIHISVNHEMDNFVKKVIQKQTEVVKYYLRRPYLDFRYEVKKDKKKVQESLKYEDFFGKMRYGVPTRPGDEVVAKEQAKLDNMVKDIQEMVFTIPYYKWGYIPSKPSFKGLLAYMFLHGGWLHLIGNLLFLYLSGPFIEDVWGKPIYIAFYVLAGIFSAQVYAIHYPSSTLPLIGASGAIAGAMGAFLIRYWNTKIKFFFIFIFWGTFKAPAWMMLPLWLLNEIFNAKSVDVYNSSGEGGGVAHWAHIGGFVFGLIFAFLMTLFKIEKKFIEPKIKNLTTYVDKNFEAMENAKALLENGDKEKAYALLLETVKKDPTYRDTVEMLWDLGIQMECVKEVAPYLAKLIEKEIRCEDFDDALFHFTHLKERAPETFISKQSKIKLAGTLLAKDETKEAAVMMEELLSEVNLSSPPGILIDMSAIALKIDFKLETEMAEKVIDLCLKHPEITDVKKDELRALLIKKPELKQKAMGIITLPTGVEVPKPENYNTAFENFSVESHNHSSSAPAGVPEVIPAGGAFGSVAAFRQGSPVNEIIQPPPLPTFEPSFPDFTKEDYQEVIPPPVPKVTPPPIPMDAIPPVPVRKLNVTTAVPAELKEGKLVINAEGVGQRILSLERVKAISVVKISPQDRKPYLILDIILSDIKVFDADIRIIRLISSNFNPVNFFPQAQTPLKAFRAFNYHILELSKAAALPNLQSVLLENIVNFKTLQEYEEFLVK